MYQYNEKLNIGASFRSKVEHEFDTNLSGPMQVGIVTELAVPAIADISSSYALTNDLNLLASIQLHRWSEWDQTSFGDQVAIQRDWEDVWKFAIGTDYRLNADWRLKAGFSYETSPQDDPTKQWVDLPVGEQYRYSVGASTQWEEYTFDIFYEYADLGSVDIARDGRVEGQFLDVTGSFDGRIHFIGASMTF
ncbi:outer membrane protein transport protein, partial [Vibrio makurazakiensis]|uniref:OmpP1/FadL family transporter n=1 Tax=Vibrio makurazakiensis TaxID=2910250 RepID=UPI003D0D150A